MTETQPLSHSFRGWYGRTIGKWHVIAQVAAWTFFGPVIPIAYGAWRYMMWAADWYKTHGKEAAGRLDATATWVEPTVTKRGRFRRGYWRRK